MKEIILALIQNSSAAFAVCVLALGGALVIPLVAWLGVKPNKMSHSETMAKIEASHRETMLKINREQPKLIGSDAKTKIVDG